MIYFSDFGTGGPVSGTVTWNPSDKHANITLSNGDMYARRDVDNALRSVRATLGRSHTDKGYFEVYNTSNNGVEYAFGADFRLYGLSTTSLSVNSYPGADANGWGFYEETGQKYHNGTGSAFSSPIPFNSTVMIWLDNGSIWAGVDGTWVGNPSAGTGAMFTGLTGTLFPTAGLYLGDGAFSDHLAVLRVNDAQCTYSPPDGTSYWER